MIGTTDVMQYRAVIRLESVNLLEFFMNLNTLLVNFSGSEIHQSIQSVSIK